MKKNSFKVFYDAPETGGSGGGTPGGEPAGGGGEPNGGGELDGNIDPTNPNPGNPANPVDPNANPAGGGEEGFDPDKMNFGNLDDPNSGTGEFDMNSMSFLEKEGIDIKDENISSAIKELHTLGVTDPQVIGNIMRKSQEANKQPTAAEIQETLNKELTPELKANYSMINNALKKAWGENEEFKELIPSFMQSPKAIAAMNMLITKMQGGANPNPNLANITKTSTGMPLDAGIKAFDEQMAKSIQENGRNNYLDQKTKIVNEIASKLNPTDVQAFRQRYE